VTRLRTERLLGRMFFGRLFESELMPPGLPQLQVVIWGIAMFAAPGYVMSFVFAIKYGGVPAIRLVQATQADQLFFVTFGMMAIGVVALFMWESLFPDRRDVRILGVLPLRTRAHVLGRIGAAGAVATLFCIGINLLPAVLYGLTLWGNNVAAGPVRAIAAHFIATAMGGVFIFFTLMVAQGLLLNVFGRRMAQRCALTLQAVFVVILLQSLVFIPGLALVVRGAFTGDGSATVTLLPPVWFLALYDVLAGAPRATPVKYACAAVVATIAVVASATALLAGSYGRLVRMAIETPDEGVHAARGLLQHALQRLGILITTHPVERAIVGFTLCTLTRSRSHLILLATYLGLGGALALPGLVRAVSNSGTAAFDAASVSMLSVPLVFNFVALCGLRMMFAIPIDIKANWVFRLHARADCAVAAVRGVRTAQLLAVVAPISVAAGILGGALWGPSTGLRHGLFVGLLGLLLIDILLIGFRKIPFTCTYDPGRSRAKILWPLYAVAFSAYAYSLARVEVSSLTHVLLYGLVIAVIAAVIVTLEHLRRRYLERLSSFAYEHEDPDALFQGFRLSEGLAAESEAHRTPDVAPVIGPRLQSMAVGRNSDDHSSGAGSPGA
jgi:hypothetical protein